MTSVRCQRCGHDFNPNCPQGMMGCEVLHEGYLSSRCPCGHENRTDDAIDPESIADSTIEELFETLNDAGGGTQEIIDLMDELGFDRIPVPAGLVVREVNGKAWLVRVRR